MSVLPCVYILCFLTVQVLSDESIVDPIELRIHQCSLFVDKQEAAFYNHMNKISEEKSWLWWLFSEQREKVTRTSNEVKEMWTYLHGLYNKLDEMKDEARRVKGVYSQLFYQEIHDHASKVLGFSRQIVEALVFLEAVELVLLSFFFSPIRHLLNVESREPSSQSNVFVIALLVGFYLLVGGILWFLFFAITVPYVVLNYHVPVWQCILLVVGIDFVALAIVAVYLAVLAAVSYVTYVYVLNKQTVLSIL